jgi:hypothetical protein
VKVKSKTNKPSGHGYERETETETETERETERIQKKTARRGGNRVQEYRGKYIYTHRDTDIQMIDTDVNIGLNTDI